MVFDLQKYMEKLEKDVFEKCVLEGRLGKDRRVPVRPGRLDRTRFGDTVGTLSCLDTPMAIEYYGLLKKTKGFWKAVGEVSGQVKSIKIPVVHFSATPVQNEVAGMAPELAQDFPKFKKAMLRLRGFKCRNGR